MKKMMEAKRSMLESLSVKKAKVVSKLAEKEGSLLEYLGEHIIAVVIIGIVLAALVAVIKTNVMPGITQKITDAFNFS